MMRGGAAGSSLFRCSRRVLFLKLSRFTRFTKSRGDDRMSGDNYLVMVQWLWMFWMAKRVKMGGKEGTKVSAEKVTKRDIIETVTANGKIQPETELKISPDVSGQIVEANQAVTADPALVNRDAYGGGWFYKIKLSNPAELNHLLSPESYKAQIGQ